MADSAGGRKQPPALLTNNHPTTPTPPTPPTPTTTKPVTLPQARSNPMTQSSGEKNKSAIICYNLLSLIGCIWIASYWNDHSMWKTRLDYFKFQLLDFKDQQNLFHQVSFVWPRRMLRAYGKQHIGKRAANTFVEETLSGRTWYLKCRKIFKLLEFRVPQPAVAHLKEAPVPEIKRTNIWNIIKYPDLQIFTKHPPVAGSKAAPPRASKKRNCVLCPEKPPLPTEEDSWRILVMFQMWKKTSKEHVWHVTLPQYSSAEMNHPEKWTVSAL